MSFLILPKLERNKVDDIIVPPEAVVSFCQVFNFLFIGFDDKRILCGHNVLCMCVCTCMCMYL